MSLKCYYLGIGITFGVYVFFVMYLFILYAKDRQGDHTASAFLKVAAAGDWKWIITFACPGRRTISKVRFSRLYPRSSSSLIDSFMPWGVLNFNLLLAVKINVEFSNERLSNENEHVCSFAIVTFFCWYNLHSIICS